MRNQIITGDALSMLRTLPDSFVQCCVTSPPYYGLRDYGIEGQIGLEDTPQAYIARLVEVFREVKRVLRDDGVLWLNIGDSYSSGETRQTGRNDGSYSCESSNFHGMAKDYKKTIIKMSNALPSKNLMMIPARVALALQADGWYLRSDIIWSKSNCMPESVTDRPTSAHEHVFLLAKSANYYYDGDAIREPLRRDYSLEAWANKIGKQGNKMNSRVMQHNGTKTWNECMSAEGRNKRNVWTIASQPYSEAHFATMPPKLVEPCVLAGSSPRACEHCGAPWERVTERIQFGKAHSNTKYTNEKYQATRMNGSKQAYRAMGLEGPPTPITLGWQPTCTCTNEGSGKCIVLDPFMGAGTVALVAIQHKRDYLGIELNPSYCELINKRIDTVQQGLWTEVAS